MYKNRSIGGMRGFASLEKLEAAFEKVMREVKDTKVTGERLSESGR